MALPLTLTPTRRVPVSSPEAPTEEAPLASLLPGEAGVIERVDGDVALAERLADLGFLPGTPVLVLRCAPLGDPVEYELRGFRICLRRSEAKRVAVRRSG